MKRLYVGTRTAQFYEDSSSRHTHPALIFGDEVEVLGAAENERVPVRVRALEGFVREVDLMKNPALEIYFIDVGQGDATFIVTPGRKKILIDGGVNRRAMGFLAWKYRLADVTRSLEIDLLVLTHADGDHLKGLVPILKHPRINVRKVVHSGIATFAEGAHATALGDLDPTKAILLTRHDRLEDLADDRLSADFGAWRDALQAKGCQYRAVDSDSGTLDVGDPQVTIEVLGPRLAEAGAASGLRWYGSPSKTINGNSVVLRLNHRAVTVLLAGDLNGPSSDDLLADPSIAARVDAHVFKAPHHGSHDFSREFLAAVAPQVSVISSGDTPDHGHPRASFLGAIGQVSRSETPLLFSTEIAASFHEAGGAEGEEGELCDVDASTADGAARAGLLFKRRLHGMINVRTDGSDIYCARRVAAVYYWESYGPLRAVRRGR